ncbi:MAG TPA: aldehyde dehydrogenase, partial [Myxococcales bacterium]|nr:aldehyde dehydrogenase [Myxococcales bacterium]
TEGRNLEQIGQAKDGELPWTLIAGLDANNQSEPLFQIEPFCALLSFVELDAADPVAFMKSATEFCNETLWGQLGATVIVPPSIERHPTTAQALALMLDELRYGAIGVNQWSAVNYSLGVTPWGSFPDNTLQDIGSGIGFVHNTPMFEGLEKSISRASIVPVRLPPWMLGHNHAHVAAKHCVNFENDRSILTLAKAALAGIRG